MALPRLDLVTLRAKTERVVELSIGESVTIRRIGRLEYLDLLPPMPAEVSGKPLTGTETKEETEQYLQEATGRELAWIRSLGPAERVARRAEMLECMYVTVARAIIDPRMPVDDVRRLGDDAHLIFSKVREFWDAEKNAPTNGGAVTIAAVEV